MGDPENRIETRFDPPGTLRPPGPIGRLVRLGWGVVCMIAAWSIWSGLPYFTGSRLPTAWTWWLGVVALLAVTPYVVNIGLGVNWRGWPRRLAVAGLVTGMTASWVVTGSPWSPAVGWLTVAWQLSILVSLGVSFLLSAAAATPGCEMRAIPHIWSRITDRPTREHYCPGHIRTVDTWEANRIDHGTH